MVLLFALGVSGARSDWQVLSASSCSTDGQLKAWPEAVGRIWLCGAPSELFSICQWRVCRAGSSNMITVFAFLVLSLIWLPGFADHSEFFLGNIPVWS